LLASDDIRLTTTAKTNAQTGRVTVREVFTRGGHTNLVRVTTVLLQSKMDFSAT